MVLASPPLSANVAPLEYVKSGDIQKVRALSNRDLSPHLSFVDMGGHGYAVVGSPAMRSKPSLYVFLVHSSGVRGPTGARCFIAADIEPASGVKEKRPG
jgi:hypothetical protein